MRPGSDGRQLIAAIAVSTAAHAGLLALLGTNGPSVWPATAPLTVSLVTVGDDEPALVAPATPVRPSRRDRSERGRSRARGDAATPEPAPRPPGGGSPGEAGLASPGLGISRTPPDLSVSPGRVFGQPRSDTDAGGGRSSPDAGETRGAVDPNERARAALAELAAAARAQVPDAYWSPIRERLVVGFAPTWEDLEDGAGTGRQIASGLARTFSGYLRNAERYGRGNGFAAEEGADGDRGGEAGRVRNRFASVRGDDGSSVVGAGGAGNAFRAEVVALVRIEQRADGSLAHVELVTSSGHRRVDAAALAAARAALTTSALGPPPLQGRRTLWAFLARFEMVPPSPVLTCPLDAVSEADLSRCVWPLKRLVDSSVELRGIE